MLRSSRFQDLQALLKAFNSACQSPSPSHVIVPKGQFKLGDIRMTGPCKAPIEITIQGTLGANGHAIAGKDRWITFEKIKGFKLNGGGTFDGEGNAAWRVNNCHKTFQCKKLPISVRLDFIEHAEVRDLTSIDAKNFHFNLISCVDLIMNNIKIIAPDGSPNTDGIHLGRCTDVKILNSHISTGDDCISVGDEMKNLLIEKVVCGPGHGISVGSLGRYGLGTSEIERNKRLENLISRRRSRRLFLLAAERSLIDMEVPRICVGRNYFGLDKENYEIDGLVMPGSAPSVLLPRRNPFDLPYDPQEEKPNLTGDSFQQEFAEANPRDSFLCRHESFHHRVFPSGLQKDSRLTSSWRNDVGGEPKPLQGSDIQLPLMKERDVTKAKGDEMDAGEVRIETYSIRNDYSDSNTSLSPREREKDFNVSDQSDASGTFCKRNDNVGNSLAGLVPRSSGSSSLVAARQKYMEQFGYSSKKFHMVTQSFDSDLQVEVSELGSPPTSVDGNDSSDEERSLFIHESEAGKEMGFGNGESEMLPSGKADQDLDEEESLASPEIEEAGKLESMVPHPNEVFSKTTEELKKLPENSADEIKISYDSDEPGQSERTDQESEEPSERNDGEEMQQLAEAEASDVNHHGNSEESATCPSSVLPDMLTVVDQTHSENLDRTSDGQLRDVDPPAESSPDQLHEHSVPTEQAIIEAVSPDATGTIQKQQEGTEVTLNDESKSAEDHRILSITPSAEELRSYQTDDGIN